MLDWASLILRCGLGVMFTAHGLQLAFGLFTGPGINGFSETLSGLGFVPATLWAYVAAYVTLIGGVCLILGFLVKTSAFLLLIFISVAAAKVHMEKGFFLANGGYEYTFIIACICLALMVLGAGKFSISEKF